MGLEGLQGMLPVGGREDHRRRPFRAGQVARRLQTIHDRHANIQEHQVGLQGLALQQGIATVGRLATDLQARHLLHQGTQPFPRQRLVIDDDTPQEVTSRGRRSSTS